jgi:anti-sigma B factor antagonist
MIVFHERDHVAVLSASGEWDLASAEVLRSHLDRAIAGSWSVIVLDLAEVTFIDVTGVKPIRAAIKELRETSRQLLVVNPSPRIARTLKLLGLADWVVPVEQLPTPLLGAPDAAQPSSVKIRP